MYDDLLKRLRAIEGATTKRFRNPDGAEAADLIEWFLSQLPDCPDPVSKRSDSVMEFIAEIDALQAERGAWGIVGPHDILPDGRLVFEAG